MIDWLIELNYNDNKIDFVQSIPKTSYVNMSHSLSHNIELFVEYAKIKQLLLSSFSKAVAKFNGFDKGTFNNVISCCAWCSK